MPNSLLERLMKHLTKKLPTLLAGLLLAGAALAAELKQPVIIENLGGAGGAIAAQKVLNAPADGYYLFQGSPNELILAPLAMAAVKYRPDDFRLVQRMALAPMGVVARGNFPPRTADEFAAYAQKAARDGKPVTYASVGTGSFYHLLGEQMDEGAKAYADEVTLYQGIARTIGLKAQ
jgi:tripartite-type tricarboxylate transporter receptor subunit TctC